MYKLQHLLAALTGKAASVVGTRQPTAAGYLGAWARLCEVYNDNYLIVQAVLRSIFELPKLAEASHDGLRKLVDTMLEATRQLQTIGIQVAHWDQILVFMLVSRLDDQTANAWEMQREAALPTLSDLCAFLDRKARSVAHEQAAAQAGSGTKRNHNGERAKRNFSSGTPQNSGANASGRSHGRSNGPIMVFITVNSAVNTTRLVTRSRKSTITRLSNVTPSALPIPRTIVLHGNSSNFSRCTH